MSVTVAEIVASGLNFIFLGATLTPLTPDDGRRYTVVFPPRKPKAHPTRAQRREWRRGGG